MVPSHTSLDEPEGSASRPDRNTNPRFGFLTVPLTRTPANPKERTRRWLARSPCAVERLEVRELLSSLSYSLTTDKSTYQVGQSVVLTFTETNTSDQPVNVTDGPATDGFTVSEGGTTIWQSNSGINRPGHQESIHSCQGNRWLKPRRGMVKRPPALRSRRRARSASPTSWHPRRRAHPSRSRRPSHIASQPTNPRTRSASRSR